MMSVLQVLALDIGTDLLPALALGAEKPERGVRDRPAREARLLDRRVLGRAFGSSAPWRRGSRCRSSLSAPRSSSAGPASPPCRPRVRTGPSSTMVFAAIVAMQMANAFECRSNPASLFSIGPLSNYLLVGAVGVEALTLLAFVYAPPISHLLGSIPSARRSGPPSSSPRVVLLAAEEGRKAIVRRRSPE